MFRKVAEYVKFEDMKLIYMENKINIINYKRINIFDIDKIEVRCHKKKVIVKGDNLGIKKLYDEELLIEGKINSIIFEDLDD